MRFFIVLCDNYITPSNRFIMDTLDDSIEFVSKHDYDIVTKHYRIRKSVFNSIVKYGDVMVRLMLSINDTFELYRNDKAKLSLGYDKELSVWRLYLDVICEDIDFIMTAEYRHVNNNMFLWNKLGNSSKCYTVLPDYYVGYLMSDSSRLENEMVNILSHTCFVIVQPDGDSKVYEGLN